MARKDGTVYVPDDNEQGVGDWIPWLAEEDLEVDE
jgi:hypothetical protein